MSKQTEGFEDTCQSALDYYEHHIALKHLNVTSEIISEWEQFCPFINADTGLCTLHPYEY